MTQECGALGGKCAEGPKRHHKCGHQHKRVAGAVHTMHKCKYCGAEYS